MSLTVSLKSFALRFLPEPILRRVRKAHYARKLIDADPEPEMSVLRHLVPTGGCAVDLGANFGLYTRFLAEAVGSDGVVHAAEPVPAMYDVLRSNVRRLHLSQVRTHPVAVSDATRTVMMTVPQYATGGANHYEARVVTTSGGRPGTGILVPGIRLDDLIGHLPRIDLIKCDVEGHELAVIRGAETILRQHRPAWMIEISGDPEDPGSAAAEVIALMEGGGYEMFWFDGRRLRPRGPGDRAVNYFFLRPGHVARLLRYFSPMTNGPTVPV
jgi:FkbM family methyltransferase